MSWQCWTFRIIDTCFFRDSLPYNASEGGYTVVRGGFPPFITTLQGAIRTSLALERGWRPDKKNSWPARLGGHDDLGDLQLRGPYLVFEEQPFFAMPLFLLKRKVKKDGHSDDTTDFIRLKPGGAVECDMGVVRLPELEEKAPGAELPDGLYLSRSGMQKVLGGGAPALKELREGGSLWFEEPRTGLERDDDTCAAREGMLCNCIHIRPDKRLRIAVLVSGVPGDWEITPCRAINLGGEGRMAEIRIEQSIDFNTIIPPKFVLQPSADGVLRFTVILITPGWYEDICKVIREGPPGIPGRCVSACVGRAVQAGGWDLAGNMPRPLVPLLPPGSAWFFEANAAEIKKATALHGQCLGDRAAYGFGQVLIGRWGDDL